MAKTRTAPVADARKAAAPGRDRSVILSAALFCVTLVAYWPDLQGSLVWDDAAHITRADLQPWHGLWRIWFDPGATQQYYPLLHSGFWVEHRIWGDAVLGYHLTNVVLHATSACLVVLIVRRLALPGAWLAGFLFALHPVYVESVAWMAEQKSVLSGLFCLAAALVYLDYDQSRRRSQYLLATGLFVLALLSKTVTATLPAALLVVFWWKRGHIDGKRDWLPLTPWLATGAFAGLFTAWIERRYVGAVGADFNLTPLRHILLASRAIWFYAGSLVWPASLAFSYPRWTIDAGQWWQYLFPAGVLAVAIGFALLARRRRGPLAASLIFAGTLFPVLGFLNVYPFRFSWVADHFQYLASLGLIVPLAAALAMLPRAVPVGLLALLAACTWAQNGTYRDAETLYRASLARYPDSFLAHHNLGDLLQPLPGRLDDAIAEYQAAVRIAPDFEKSHCNLGHALLQAGRLPEAVSELQIALRIKPDYAQAHNNLGSAWAQMPGRLPDAIAEFQAALRTDPHFAEAHFNLGNAYAQIPRLPDAVTEFQAAIRIDPGDVAAHTNLGGVWAQMPGHMEDAIGELQTAVRLAPGRAEGHYNLGSALAQVPGRTSGAIAEFEAALRIRPDFEPAREALEELRKMSR